MTGNDAVSLRALGCQCRRLARGASRRDVAASLNEMAQDYDRKADKAEAIDGKARQGSRPA